MRKIIFGINITLDGCCDHTKGKGSEEVHAYFTDLLRDADVLVYGRKTYQLMVPFWPDIAKNHSGQTKSTIDFAEAFDSVKKIIVFSKTLEQVEGKNTSIVRTNLYEEMLKLKQEPGGNILIGGVDIPSQLIKLGLVDEYRFMVQPIIAGEGRRLLAGINLPETLQLKLVESTVFNSGHIALRYLQQ
jgi:dihydrofolate reductase